MVYATILNRIAIATIDIKLQTCLGIVPGTIRTPYVDFEKVLRNAHGALTYLPTKLLVSLLQQHRIASHSVLAISQIAETETPRSRDTCLCILVGPMEHFRRHSQKFLKFWLRIQYGVHTIYP